MNIPRQAQFLYKGLWTPEGDDVLVNTLIRLKNETMWTLDEFPSYFLLTAMREIERKLGMTYTEWDLKARVKIMLLRYRTFKEVNAHRGTHWNRPEKIVTADDDVWKEIFEKNSYARAYYYEHEPIFNELAMLFGMDDVKLEQQSPTVIVISDTTVVEPYGDGDEEVNSPAIFPTFKVKRKLFVDEDGASDRESTNQPPNPLINAGADVVVVNRVAKSNKYPTNSALVQAGGTPQRASPITSSCASSSPAAWWRHPEL
ncbi:hypothetical protein SASPL_112099 [Salvia splendens]|uniref:Myb/SANT-like domain-containing protein n=1 Tax=Salvia splendens TaxID=180675 RepID=A0A8X8YC03_SALSN|nr:uncharacterized protein LOC121801362 [Salvia splendens]KAG6427852.1 hypothetical protein SASPL_112099 [Salvia splendens]